MFGLSSLKRALKNLGEPMHPRAERRPAPGLAAYYGLESPSTPADIKDISSSGIYLFTEKRLASGEVITLKLQQQGDPENAIELRFIVDARIARQGEDGLGLSFLLPKGLDTNLWGVLVRNIVILTDRGQIAQMFRTLRTILFLCRLCQSGAEEAILLLGGQLNEERTEAAVKVALTAESQLSSQPDAGRMRADPKVVANILRDASWATDELTMQLWTGLLISSCSLDAADDSNQILVDVFVQVTPIQARILSHACERGQALREEGKSLPPGTVILDPKQIIELTGVSDLTRNATDLAYLYNLGLIQKLFDFTSYHDVETYDITPTNLGMVLYRHCRGERGKIDQQLVETARNHLQNFLPPARSLVLDDDAPTTTPRYTPGD